MKSRWICVGVVILGLFSSAMLRANEALAPSGRPLVKCDFRVNSRISRNEDKDSIMEGKTLFHDGVVYDFLGRFQEVAVFNFETGRVYLLDLKNKKKTVVTMDQIQENTAKLQEWGAAQSHQEVKNYIAPKFEVNINKDAEPEEYTFKSLMLVYHVVPTKPGSPEMLEAYQRFADMSCQFNLMLSPGVRTLFGRMEVNKTLFRAGRLVARLQVDVTFPKGLFFQKETYFSTLQYLPRLVESDLASIRQIDEYLATFSEVSLAEYKTARGGQEK